MTDTELQIERKETRMCILSIDAFTRLRTSLTDEKKEREIFRELRKGGWER